MLNATEIVFYGSKAWSIILLLHFLERINMKYVISTPILCLFLSFISMPGIANAGIGKFLGNVIFKEGGKIIVQSAAKGFASEFGSHIGKKAATAGLALLASKYPPEQHSKINRAQLVDGRPLYYVSNGNDSYGAYVGRPSHNLSYEQLMQREYELMTPAQKKLYNTYATIINNYMNEQKQEIEDLNDYTNTMLELLKNNSY